MVSNYFLNCEPKIKLTISCIYALYIYPKKSRQTLKFRSFQLNPIPLFPA